MTSAKALYLIMERAESLLDDKGIDRKVAQSLAGTIAANDIPLDHAIWALDALKAQCVRNVRYYLDHRRRKAHRQSAVSALKMAKVYGKSVNAFRKHIHTEITWQP